MVKGISRQVIVVQSPDKALFDQAIFILKDKAVAGGVTDADLLKEAKKLMGTPPKRKLFHYGTFWACSGAVFTGLVWLVCALL